MRYEVTVLICIFVIIICSCVTARTGSDTTILEHQRQITELEARNTELERRLSAYDSAIKDSVAGLELIAARSRTMEGTVDEIIFEFEQYQHAVERLISEYNKIKLPSE